jgi:tetratricopeptide (TPR) repeat protein
MSAEATNVSGSKGYNDEELLDLQKAENSMQVQDGEITALLAQRNALEAYLLECRGYPHRQHGESIPALKLEDMLNEYENWLWDCPDAGIVEVEGKFASLQTDVKAMCKDFLAKKEEEEKRVEAELEASAAKAAAEKELNGDDDDHDNRKLKKADRMRLVVKNKEEGTEIFKGGVWRTAAARYHKALTHCSKFFDLTPADEEEVKNLKVTLYLNLASCYLKMESYEQAINNCTFAIDLDKRSAKAYYRRALARETKKEYEEALEDAMNAQSENVVADKQINALVSKLKKVIAAEKKKEQATWGKAFGSGGGSGSGSGSGGGGKKKGKK